METRASAGRPAPRGVLTIQGLTLDARVDFTHAQRGEVMVVAPFRQALRIQERIRNVPPVQPAPAHPIHRALKWQHLLEAGSVPNRSALARRVSLTPGAITRIMKLVELDPGIQAYPAALKSAAAIRHFGYRALERLAAMLPNDQKTAFDRMRAKYESRERRRLVRAGIPPSPAMASSAVRAQRSSAS